MIELCGADLAATVDPSHGAEVLELVDRRSERQILARPPFVPASPRGGDLDEDMWTASYRGGWQIAAPNAGNACEFGGERHGFHGRASVDPWEVVEQDAASVVMRWLGHGLELTRALALADRTATVDVTWTALDQRAPLIAVEHICFGRELLDPSVEVHAAARAHELSESKGPRRTPPLAPAWPESLLLDGQTERAGTWPLVRERSRFTALTGFRSGSAEIHNRERNFGVRLEWDHEKLPAAWLWHEVRGSGGIWRQQGELLAFEPASVPHSLGLAEAVREGQALWADPGRRDGYRLSLTVLDTFLGAG